MRKDIDRAQHTADVAINSIESHEKICSLRYENINTKLDNIPKLFDLIGATALSLNTKLDGAVSKVNIASGVWIGVLGVGAVVTLCFTVSLVMVH